GTSAVMLSGETAVGEYPLEAVAYMDRIARAIEPSMGYRHEIPAAEHNPTIGGAMSNAACDVAEALRASAILVPTYRGKTASRACAHSGRSSRSRTWTGRCARWLSSGA